MSTPTPFGPLHGPARAASPAPSSSPTDEFVILPRAASAAGARLLIVDHDPLACAEIGGRLNRLGYSVALACTTDLADVMRRVVPFDLVISEVRPAELTSWSWIERLLSSSATPVILTSSDPTAEATLRSGPRPPAAVLARPVDHDTLAALVSRLLPRSDSAHHNP